MTRIADATTIGRFTVSHEISIGYHDCACCGNETPTPPQDVIDDYVRGGGRGTLWPNGRNDGWHPPGWINLPEYGWLCDLCARVVMTVLSRRKGRAQAQHEDDRFTAADLARLQTAVSEAIALTELGLGRDFPPPPQSKQFSDGLKYFHPSFPRRVWDARDYYREGMLRHQLRRIQNVLLGKPADHGEDL